MATSGTIGQTTFEVVDIIEHAFRRCGKVSSTIVQEQLQIARDNLGLILLTMVNTGIKLWTIEKHVLGLSENNTTYELPVGTIDMLNTMLRTIETTTPTWSTAATSWTGVFDSDTRVLSFSITPTTTQTLALVAETSPDGVTWTTIKTIASASYTAGKIYWFDLDPTSDALYFRVRETVAVALTLTAITCATTITERVLARINRDDYIALPNKYSQGTPTQFWFDRQLSPRLWLWSVPNDETQSVVTWVQRDLQDAGTYTNTLAIPNRWIEAMIWHLAAKLCFEIPDVDPGRISMVQAMADKHIFEVEAEEYDNSPVYLQPNIGVYTR